MALNKLPAELLLILAEHLTSKLILFRYVKPATYYINASTNAYINVMPKV